MGLAPTGKRRLVTAHTLSGPSTALVTMPAYAPKGPFTSTAAHRRGRAVSGHSIPVGRRDRLRSPERIKCEQLLRPFDAAQGIAAYQRRATKTRGSWRKLHIGVDADTGQIIAAELTSKDADDGFAGRSLA